MVDTMHEERTSLTFLACLRYHRWMAGSIASSKFILLMKVVGFGSLATNSSGELDAEDCTGSEVPVRDEHEGEKVGIANDNAYSLGWMVTLCVLKNARWCLFLLALGDESNVPWRARRRDWPVERCIDSRPVSPPSDRTLCCRKANIFNDSWRSEVTRHVETGNFVNFVREPELAEVGRSHRLCNLPMPRGEERIRKGHCQKAALPIVVSYFLQGPQSRFLETEIWHVVLGNLWRSREVRKLVSTRRYRTRDG